MIIIQIQHLLKLNLGGVYNGQKRKRIQIQHLLKLNYSGDLSILNILMYSNTTLVKVKYYQVNLTYWISKEFKYNTC